MTPADVRGAPVAASCSRNSITEYSRSRRLIVRSEAGAGARPASAVTRGASSLEVGSMIRASTSQLPEYLVYIGGSAQSKSCSWTLVRKSSMRGPTVVEARSPSSTNIDTARSPCT